MIRVYFSNCCWALALPLTDGQGASLCKSCDRAVVETGRKAPQERNFGMRSTVKVTIPSRSANGALFVTR
jgi:hypothetical protein